MRVVPHRALLLRRRTRRALLLRIWGRRLPVRAWTISRRVRGAQALLGTRFGAAKGVRFAGLPHRRRQGFTLRALLRRTWATAPCLLFFVAKSVTAYRRLKEGLDLAGLPIPLSFFSLARRWSAAQPSALLAGLQGALLALHAPSVEQALRVAAWLDHPDAVCAGVGVRGRLLTLDGLCATLAGLPGAAGALSALAPQAGLPLMALFPPFLAVAALLGAWCQARAPAS